MRLKPLLAAVHLWPLLQVGEVTESVADPKKGRYAQFCNLSLCLGQVLVEALV